MITANYHTHTVRCHHASGSEREYIESAIKLGLKTLGFSDHYTYAIQDGIIEPYLNSENYFEYYQTLSKLKAEYSKDIKILIGIETVYFKDYFENEIEKIKPYLDYVIQGQHFCDNGCNSFESGHSEEDLNNYCQKLIQGINSGLISYIAHPDVFIYEDNAVFYKYFKEVCVTAKNKNIPLEFNFLGFGDGRHYPSEKFLRIASEVGNDIIFGIDAHHLFHFDRTEELCERAEKVLKQYGLKRTETIKLLKEN